MTTRRCRILHTSDIHLDNRVGETTEPSGGEVGLTRVVDKAIEEQVDLFLLAGDLFDHNRVKDPCREFASEQLARVPCPVVMICGNHDCLADYSIYHKYQPEHAGEHIHFLRDEAGASVRFSDLGVTVWGRGIVDHHPDNKPIGEVPAHTDEDHWYVGMAHGYYVNRGAQMFSSLITPEEIAASQLHYLALGHVHVFTVMNHGRTTAAYSGSPNLEQGAREMSAALVELCPDRGVLVDQLVL